MFSNTDVKNTIATMGKEWKEAFEQARVGGLAESDYWTVFLYSKCVELQKAQEASDKIIAQLTLSVKELQKQLEQEKQNNSHVATSLQEFLKNTKRP